MTIKKVIEDLSNVIADIDSIAAINNYFNNDVTGMANHIVIFFFLKHDMLYE